MNESKMNGKPYRNVISATNKNNDNSSSALKQDQIETSPFSSALLIKGNCSFSSKQNSPSLSAMQNKGKSPSTSKQGEIENSPPSSATQKQIGNCSFTLKLDDFDESPSAIMQSIDYPGLLMLKPELNDAKTGGVSVLECSDMKNNSNQSLEKSFLLLDDMERLKFSTPEEFLDRLKCDENAKVKVVSIFGNTGDGKSHTLNAVFFEGKEIFLTSSDQMSCTIGVWVAYDPRLNVLCLDTEGLLGATSNENRRTRLLLKVLAISDIIIYRTRSERLHRDLYTFLGTASRAYTHHFTSALQNVCQKAEFGGALSALGPVVIIFHETLHTSVLKSSGNESAEDILRSHFARLNLDIEAFSSLKYIGTQTMVPPTRFTLLREAIIQELNNTTVRSSRSCRIVFLTLKALNEKFSGDIENTMHEITFPDQYFTCSVRCMSCDSRCTASLGHLKEAIPHHSNNKCKLEHQFQNWHYVCKKCHLEGRQTIVTLERCSESESRLYSYTKYIVSGNTIVCPKHGEIYRDRKYWYGNPEPEKDAVRQEIYHVWSDNYSCHALQNSGRRVLDGLSNVTRGLGAVAAEPSRAIKSWFADQIAPSYWDKNAVIKCCALCKINFDNDITIHHCRACGKGVCNDCSSRTQPVPKRQWKDRVRVCDNCFTDSVPYDSTEPDDQEETNRARICSETVVSTLSPVLSIFEYSKNAITESARPDYWVPDAEIEFCKVCNVRLRRNNQIIREIHHCRACGEGICSSCSRNFLPVPERGWGDITPVRVCDNCVQNTN